MSNEFRETLIQAVDQEGRDGYRSAIDSIGEIEGRQGVITGLGLRVIKGIQRLQLQEAILTTEGLATPERKIVDCSAVMVKPKRKGSALERYSGKDSAHPTRLFSSYDQGQRQFSLWSERDNGSKVVQPKSFDASILAPRDGECISVKFGNEGMLDGVLEDGEVTEHIRECLAEFEKEVENIGILLRHHDFHRFSDTRNPGTNGINTLYSDGAQLHAMNRRTIRERASVGTGTDIEMDRYRAGIEFAGEDMSPNIEDIILAMRLHAKSEDVQLLSPSGTARCLVTQRNPRTGAIGHEVKSWHRKNQPIRPDGQVIMGMNVDMEPQFDGAVIRVGDRFTVISEKNDWEQ